LPYQPVSFTNTSAVADGTALSYAWDFGDPASGIANTSNVTNPTHLYSGTGPFVVTLTVTSAPGCINTTTQNITDVYAQAHADFMVGAENCLNDVTTFTSNATGSGNPIANYRWDFGEPASGAANLSSLQNPTHTYLTPGTYSIKHWVITDKGCTSDTTTKTVVINPLPTANFNYNSPSCETRDITFTDLSLANVGTLTNWAWNFNDPASGAANTSSLQNPIHTFASSGTYNVTLTVTNAKGCVSAVLTKPVTINARPQAGFIIPEVCLSDTYAQFTDTSKIATGTITAWAWNFGDPVSGAANTSNLQNPQHSYTAVGNYSVQLIVTSNNGCKDTIVQTLTVNGSFPVANFTVNNPTTLCANDSVAIVNTSTVFPGTITKVEIYWDNVNFPATFELDDFPYAGKVYKHLYPNFQSPLAKTFTIRFRAYSGGICVNDKVSTITVNAAPKVQFNNIPNICLDAAPYQITQASEVGGVPGNGVYSGPGVSPGGLFNPATTGPGTFTIKYTYTSTVGGCVDTLSKTITVYEPPVADFSFSTSLCETKPITFTDNSNTPVGLLTTWTWDFGDGTPVVVRNTPAPFTHTFANWGAYNVSLRVATSNGCVSIAKILPVDVRPQPKPNFTFPASICLPNAVIPFTNTSTIADASALTYLWNFGDPGSGTANSSTAVSPSHTYVAVGPFNINLQATSAAGCVHDTTIALNVIHPQPKADFSINKPSVCIGQDVSFRDLSDGKDGTVNQWFWNFGDAGTSNIQNPTHLYGAVNNYVISLYIINSQGCNSDTVSKTFDVYPYPVVNAGPDKVVLEGGTVVLTASATGNDLLYLWTPATYLNDRRILQPAASNLLDDITYTLTVTARGGCAASDKVFVKLLRAPRIPNTFTPNNDGINDTWVIEYLDTYPGNRVQIFTRTGQLVFESRGYSKPWDGTMNGKPLPFDTYYYIIEPNNGRKAMTGYVTIVK
jgi:gliding motility-associated-like protein